MHFHTLRVFILATAIFSAQAFADGEAVFKQQCASCHGVKGQGMQYVAPPLKGSEFVKASAIEDIVATIRDGRTGDAKRHADYPAAMPPFPQLSEEDVAAVAEYVKGALQE